MFPLVGSRGEGAGGSARLRPVPAALAGSVHPGAEDLLPGAHLDRGEHVGGGVRVLRDERVELAAGRGAEDEQRPGSPSAKGPEASRSPAASRSVSQARCTGRVAARFAALSLYV